jgi:subtilase family serine protease
MAKIMNSPFSPHQRLWACGCIAACAMLSISIGEQSVAPRISAEITDSDRVALKGSLHPLAQPQFDTGRLPADTRLNGISLVFNRSAVQQADLEALIAAQQNPASPQFHQWLTPDQFGARFGVAASDLEQTQNWLQQQGFQIDSVARSQNLVRFSGTAAQVEQAFSTQMHAYEIQGVRHFAPSTDLSVPAALAPVVLGIRNLDDFRPRSHVVLGNTGRIRPSFTSSQSGNVFFAPGDITTAYDIKPTYASGYNGAGQSITIVGQSAIQNSDIEAFQNAAGLTVKDPTPVLMPGSGTSTLVAGDETESDLDLEWSGAIATGATINFVYTGSNKNYGAFDAIQYAVDEKLGTIISTSYGTCEPELGGSTLESVFQQATAQGQTILAASGDSGSTDCFQGTNTTNPTLAQQETIAVDYPASSTYVTGLGGTEISSSADGGKYLIAGDGYWAAESSTDIISSALQYIPEVAWNDDSPNCGTDDCISSSGGGASALFTKPSWQSGVPGIPADGKRDVPDLAMYASTNFPGYLYCTSDNTAWSTGQAASCSSGFRDASTGDLTVAGGTSFGAPIFAGMLAIINQKAGYTGGQGMVNPTLYNLAANSTTYAAAFHDITTGNNDCTAGSANCSATTGFSAGVGYDQVTGLGSVDFSNLALAWPSNSGATLIGTATTVAASNQAPTVNTSVNFTITVTADSGTATPTGTLTLTLDGGTPMTGVVLTANGTATYSTTFTTAGTHELVAVYSGDATHAGSTGTGTVNVSGISSGAGSISLSATNVTVAQGSQATSTITVTPKSGYTGTVDLSFDTSNDNALQNLCWQFTNENSAGDGTVVITGTGAVGTQLLLDANASDCATALVKPGGMHPMHSLRRGNTAQNRGTNPIPAGFALAGLLLAGFLGRSSRKFRSMACLVALLSIGLALSACGGNNSTVLTNPPQGTYTITVTGQDSATATITSTTTFTLTIN